MTTRLPCWDLYYYSYYFYIYGKLELGCVLDTILNNVVFFFLISFVFRTFISLNMVGYVPSNLMYI